MPLVSVIIPTYNRSNVLKKTIESVIAQTFTDFELIVVSNGSTDDTPQVVNSFQDARIRFVEQENSGGPSSPRNHGARIANGKYLAFTDNDDPWLPIKLAEQVQVMEANPDVGLCYGNSIRFDEQGEWYVEHENGPTNINKLLYKSTIAVSSVMVRKDLFDRIGGYDESKWVGPFEDYEFNMRYAAHAPVQHIDKVLIKYWSGNDRVTPTFERYTYQRFLTDFFYWVMCYIRVVRRTPLKFYRVIGPIFHRAWQTFKFMAVRLREQVKGVFKKTKDAEC